MSNKTKKKNYIGTKVEIVGDVFTLDGLFRSTKIYNLVKEWDDKLDKTKEIGYLIGHCEFLMDGDDEIYYKTIVSPEYIEIVDINNNPHEKNEDFSLVMSDDDSLNDGESSEEWFELEIDNSYVCNEEKNEPHPIFSTEFELSFESYYEDRINFVNNDEKTSECDEKVIIKAISNFVNKKDAYKKFDEEVHERILGQPELSKVTYNVFTWLKGLALGNKVKNNTFIAAPSGCGKTETFRVIKEILTREIGMDIPVLHLDATQLTAEGFKGKDCCDFMSGLFEARTNGIGIVCLDEIDKQIRGYYDHKGANVAQQVQGQLLTILEGVDFTNKQEETINTSNTLFFASGAFQYIRDNKKDEKHIGFVKEDKKKLKKKLSEDDITIEDIIKAGALPELVGRFSNVVNFIKLEKSSIVTIAKRYAEDFERIIGCKIKLTKNCEDYLFNTYKENELGCRTIKNTMWDDLEQIGIEIERDELLKKIPKSNIPIIIYNGEDDTKLSYIQSKKHNIDR